MKRRPVLSAAAATLVLAAAGLVPGTGAQQLPTSDGGREEAATGESRMGKSARMASVPTSATATVTWPIRR